MSPKCENYHKNITATMVVLGNLKVIETTRKWPNIIALTPVYAKQIRTLLNHHRSLLVISVDN